MVNLRIESKRKVVFAGVKLERNLKNQLINLLNEFKDVFAFSYEDMPSLNTDIVVHRLPVLLKCKLVKQKLRRIKPQWDMKKKIK